jgi:hypothetical protein
MTTPTLTPEQRKNLTSEEQREFDEATKKIIKSIKSREKLTNTANKRMMKSFIITGKLNIKAREREQRTMREHKNTVERINTVYDLARKAEGKK